MAESRAAWGIDIGQSGLKAIKVREGDAGQIFAEQFDYIPFPKILSQPDAIPDEIVPAAMDTFLSRNNLQGDLVAISVPGQSALARFISLPPVESSKLHEIVKYEARQQIPFALEEVIWDYQPLGAGAEESGFLLDAEVGLFAMKRDQIAKQLEPYQEAKVEVELIQIAPLALYNVLSVDEMGIRADSEGEPGEEHYIVLDMGCDNTTLMVTNGYNLWIRNVPIGGNHFTRALTKEMKLSFAKAEHLKCNATKSPDPRAVFQALRPVFNDYVSEIQRSIGYFSSVNRSAKIEKVIGLGNGFKLAGLQKFLQQNLQYDVERPDSFHSLTGDTVLNSPLFSENILSFAVPYGLSLQALGLSRIHTSLLPPEITQARKIRKKKPWAVATAAAMLAGFALSTVGNAFSHQAVHTPEFAAAEKEAESFGSEVSSLASKYGSETGRYEAATERVNSLVKERRDLSWMEIYNAITDCLPRDPDGVEFGPEDISLRNQIALTEISSDRVADVGTWFATLSPDALRLLPPEDKETPPSGEGYIFTVRGKSWYNNPEIPNGRGMNIQYVVYNFLKKLQQDEIQRTGFPKRDVGNLGITHATILDFKTVKIPINLDGGPRTRESRFQNPQQGGFTRGMQGRGGGGYGGGYGGGGEGDYGGSYGGEGYGGGYGRGGGTLPTLPGGAKPENVIDLQETTFTIQFALVPPTEDGTDGATDETESTGNEAVEAEAVVEETS